MSLLDIFNIPSDHNDSNILFFLISKLYGNSYNETYITGSSKCSNKPLSLSHTEILPAVKEKPQEYRATVYFNYGEN